MINPAHGTVYREGELVLISRPRNLIIAGAFCLSWLVGLSQDKKHSLSEDPDFRSVEGLVTYAAHEPVKGAVVKCEDETNLQIRSYITAADGKYHFTNLSTNHEYELKAEKNGRLSPSKRLSRFNERKVAIIDLRLK